MTLFDNSDPEEFLLFVCDFNINLEASGMLKAGINIQYHCMMVRGGALSKFDEFSAKVESSSPEDFKYIILGLGTYFFPVNAR